MRLPVILKENFVRAVENPADEQARGMMLLAASFAGIGFGNAGVTLPHGMAVVLNAPAAFRFTAPACPEKHIQAAETLGADVTGVGPERAGPVLADQVIAYMKRLNIPNGLTAVGYTEADIPALVEGTLPQHRVIKLAPRPVGAEELQAIFKDALRYWD